MRKFDRAHLVIFKLAARGGQKRIYRRFVNMRIGIVAFALHRPKIASVGAGHQINAGVFAAKIAAKGKLLPQPHLFQIIRILWVCAQISLHQAFKACPFVALRHSHMSRLFENIVKCKEGVFHRGMFC